MRITPPEIEVGELDGFEKNDIFGFKPFGEELKHLFQNVDESLVAILDAPWGSGKTTFIKMWCGMMRNEGHPVIYFDAFANDYIDDAFIALAGEVIALSQRKSADKELTKSFINISKKVALKVGKLGGKAAIRALSTFVIGKDISDNLTEIINKTTDDIAEEFDSEITERLEKRAEEVNIFSEFRVELESLSERLTSNNTSTEDNQKLSRNLIFIIDELDRCKPPFALGLLEKIKHFFKVKGIHFILIANIQQLNESVSHSYGLKQSAESYIQKFYNIILRLPLYNLHTTKHYSSDYIAYLQRFIPDNPEDDQFSKEITKHLIKHSSTNDLSLRTINIIITQFIILMACTEKNHFRSPFLAYVLILLKTEKPQLYEKAKSQKLSLKDIQFFLQLDSLDLTIFSHALLDYCLGTDVKPVHQEIAKSLSRYDFFDKKDIIPYMCSIIDRLAITK